MAIEPEIIDIPDDDSHQDNNNSSVGKERIPVLIVEKNGDSPRIGENKRTGIWLPAMTAVVITAIVCMGMFLFFSRNRTNTSGALSEKEIIALLEKPYDIDKKGIIAGCDTILGVALEIYPLDGLRGSLETEIPDTTDRSLVAFFRSADYTPDSTAICPVVVNGDPIRFKEQNGRYAYVAVSPQGRVEIGVGEGDRVKEYTQKNGGSFFRQYLLLGDNNLPEKFSLHGKVERAALGRMNDGSLYYVVTRGKETMWGFADALREYGFMDAAYITGGDKYDFIRRPDGTFTLGDRLREEYAEQTGRRPASPMLVFRNAK